MATCRRNETNIWFYLAIFSVHFIVETSMKKMPDKTIVVDWADSIQRDLVRTSMETCSGHSLVLEKAYNKGGVPNFVANFEEIDLDGIVDKMAADLNDMLQRKMEALNNSVVRAEREASGHDWITNIKKEDVPYQDAKLLKEDDSRFVYNDKFKQNIIPNISSVHIPVEIFNGDVEILNGLKWSAALDEVFEENNKKDPEILWQYFGSQTGFMRTLPASIWKTGPQAVDLYDVRRRPWYTQGASSPKDMFILIDKSGSVHGQTLELMKVSVKSLLDTLGENDFVNIAQFNDSAKLLTDCFNGSFVQANYRNKQILMQEVETIEAEGMADFKVGLTFAFEQFEKLKEESSERRGAGCNRMIMLLTDGGSELAEEVFQKYNPKGNQTYRVFTYAVGPTANPVSAIRWMACANRGYFSQIPAMGAIRSKVQEYVDVISRPLALNQVEHGQWTSVYPGLYQSVEYMNKPAEALESYNLEIEELVHYSIKTDPWGLGMMTTVTLPVYNKTAGSTNQTILGVMGIDVTTNEMLKYAPLRKFGPNGYPFAINANGYIVFHPKLKSRDMMKDPPNVDFLDVEVESDEMLELRKDMIDGVSKSIELDTYMVSDDMHHVDVEKGERKRRYSYQPIGNTTFSLGVSVPSYHKYHLKLSTDLNNWTKDQITALLNASDTALLIADWDYYKNFTGDSSRNGTVMDLLEALENHKAYEWNNALISHLLWDLEITSMVNGYWQSVMNSNKTNIREQASNDTIEANSTISSNETDDSSTMDDYGKLFKAVFVGTNGGLTRIYPKSGEVLDDFLDKRNTWDANYFKRAVDSSDWIFSAPYVLDPEPVNGTVGDVMAVRNIRIKEDGKGTDVNYRAAVVGLVFKENALKDMMVKWTRNNLNIYDCSDSDTVACYLLDDGAFVMATNQDEFNTSVGRFFGKVDPEVMHELYNRTIYKRTEQYDYQATCVGPPPSEADGQTSAGSLSFRIPTINVLFEFITLNWWTNIVSWVFTSFNLYSMIAPSPATTVYANTHDKPRLCIMKQAQYYFNEDFFQVKFSEQGKVECEVRNIPCSREFVAVPIKNTSLLFVIAEVDKPDCEECSSKVKPLLQEPTEEGPEFCEMKPRYRKPTEMCYDHDDREDDTQCAASLTHPVSHCLVIFVTIVTVLFSQR